MRRAWIWLLPLPALALIAIGLVSCGFFDQPSTCPLKHPNCGGPDDRAVPYPDPPEIMGAKHDPNFDAGSSEAGSSKP